MAYSPTRTSDFASTISTRSTVPAVTAWAVAFAHMILVWNHRAKTRKDLRNLSADQLADLGITTQQAEMEANKRFYQQ